LFLLFCFCCFVFVVLFLLSCFCCFVFVVVLLLLPTFLTYLPDLPTLQKRHFL